MWQKLQSVSPHRGNGVSVQLRGMPPQGASSRFSPRVTSRTGSSSATRGDTDFIAFHRRLSPKHFRSERDQSMDRDAARHPRGARDAQANCPGCVRALDEGILSSLTFRAPHHPCCTRTRIDIAVSQLNNTSTMSLLHAEHPG
jgi:hypothetical protein